jgi:hypothetical protein
MNENVEHFGPIWQNFGAYSFTSLCLTIIEREKKSAFVKYDKKLCIHYIPLRTDDTNNHENNN